MHTLEKKRTSTPALELPRAELLALLERVKQVISARTSKPILACIRLEASAGQLCVTATDLDVGLSTSMSAASDLSPCIVPLAPLIQRVKATKHPTCSLQLTRTGEELLVNGGRVSHCLATMPVEEFPLVADTPAGLTVTVSMASLRIAARVALVGVAKEITRYAINGVLLESDADGVRLVATDGRRMAICDLPDASRTFTGQAIIPARVLKLVDRFAERDEAITFSIQKQGNDNDAQPGRLHASGSGWLLSGDELESKFPHYRDVIPRSASRFQVDRAALLQVLQEVALATTIDRKMVRIILNPRKITVAAETPGVGQAEGMINSKFLGGGDSEIHTAFNAAMLIEIVRSLPGEKLIIDVAQNGCGTDGHVFAKPALFYPAAGPSIRWIVMPVDPGLEPSPKSLGSNYVPPVEVE